MRKKIALLCAIIMMVTTIMPSFTVAEGEKEAQFKIETSAGTLTYAVGDTVSVIAKLTSSKDISTMTTVMLYDSTKLELDASSIKANSVLLGTLIDTSIDGRVAITASDSTTENPMHIDGEIFTVNFTVKEGAVGNTVIKLSADEMYDGTIDINPITYDEASATLTIVNPCTGITLDKGTLTIARGETATLTATVEPADTTDTIVWSSENDSIATVENGVVIAFGLGETTITAACGDKTASCKVTVTKATIAGTADIYTKEGFFYGATLGASPLITNDGWETAITTIKWYRDGEADSIATGDKYKIGEKDIGKQLYIIVTADKYTGELKSKLTDVIEKAPKNAPDKPIIEAKENVITVKNVDHDAEYLLVGDGASQNFGKETEFTVQYGKTYYVAARYPETATHKESEEAQSDPVTIDKAPCNLTVTAGEGGTVDGIPEDTVREGDKVKLTANPGDFDHKFVKWEAKGVTLTDVNKPTITFTMGKDDVEIKAIFEKKPAVTVGFGADKTFTYNGKEQAPTYGPIEQGDMKVEVKYFVRGGNMLIEKPTNVGKYTMQVTYTSSAASGFKTTVATCDFEIIKANQNEPDAPTVKDIKSDGFTVENFVTEQQYAIKTTNVTPEEAEWKNGSEFVNPVTGLKPATTYYVFTRVKGNNNYNPSPAVYATVTTAHTYAWEVEGSAEVIETVRVGGTLPEPLTGTIKNIGTGELTDITATIDSETNFTLEAVSGTLASKGSLNITVKPKDIKTDKEGTYKAAVTVKAKDVSDITVNFIIKVTEKETAEISGITDTTVTFNGKTQGIDLSQAVVTGGGKTLDASKLTVTYDAAETRNAGEYIATIKYEDADYIGNTTAKLTINKKDVTVTGFKAQSKVYDGNADAVVDSTNAKLDGMIEGTVVGFDESGLKFTFDNKKVGTDKTVTNATTPITLIGTDKDNYNLKKTTVELTADITAKPVTVTAAVAEKTYNGITDDAKVTMSASGIIAGDDVQLVATKGVYANADAGDAVEVEVNYAISGADRGNYNITKAEEKTYGKVKKADLNVTLTAPAAVTYDGKTHEVSSVTDDRAKRSIPLPIIIRMRFPLMRVLMK